MPRVLAHSSAKSPDKNRAAQVSSTQDLLARSTYKKKAAYDSNASLLIFANQQNFIYYDLSVHIRRISTQNDLHVEAYKKTARETALTALHLYWAILSVKVL